MQRLSMNQLAEILGESVRTCRVLAHEFALFIPATRVGEECFFRPDAVEILRLILMQIEVGVRKDYIVTVLSKRYPAAEVSVLMAVGSTLPLSMATIGDGLAPSLPAAEEAPTGSSEAADRAHASIPVTADTDALTLDAADLMVERRLDVLASHIEALSAQVAALLDTRSRADEPGRPVHQAPERAANAPDASDVACATVIRVRAFDHLPSREDAEIGPRRNG